MSTVPKVRFVYCPKCKTLLPEFAHFSVYECGVCGTVLQGNKKRNSTSINSESRKEHTESERNSENNGSIASSNCAILCSEESHNSDLDEGSGRVEHSDSDQNWLEVRGNSTAVSSSDEFNSCRKAESSENGEESDGFYGGRDSNSESPRPNGRLDFRGRTSILRRTDQDLQCRKDHSSLTVGQMHGGEEMEKPQKPSRMSSGDSTEASKGAEICEEGVESVATSFVSKDMVDTKLSRETSKAPTIRSSHVCTDSGSHAYTKTSHAYTDNGSSLGDYCDGLVPNQQLNLSRKTLYKSQGAPSPPQNQATNIVSCSVGDKKGSTVSDLQRLKWPSGENLSENNETSPDPELQLKVRKIPSKEPNPEHSLAVGGSIVRNHGESKTTKCGLQAQEQATLQRWQALGRDEHSRLPSSKPHFTSDPSRVYQKGGPSSYMKMASYGQEELVESSSSYASDKIECLEQDRMELLRKVDELREQLSKTCGQTGKLNGRLPISNRGVQPSEISHGTLARDDRAYRTNDTLRWFSSGKRVSGTQLDKHSHFCFNHDCSQGLPRYYTPNYHPNECLALYQNPRGVHMQRRIIPHERGFSQRPFSGHYMKKDQDSINSCTHNSHQCQYCPTLLGYPENRPIPIQFPSGICMGNGLCRASPGHVCYHPYGPSRVSQRGHLDANFRLHYRNAHPQEARLEEPEPEKIYYEDKCQSTNTTGTKANARHCRPVAGGAPFLTCYNCWNLLQIPADFLLPGRKRHKLRCGACSKLLAYSLQNGTHVVTFPTQSEHPTSELDKSADATRKGGTRFRDGALPSVDAQLMPSESDCPQSDPVSYSEDYMLSISKSCSTEGDANVLDGKQASSCFPENRRQRLDGCGTRITTLDTSKSGKSPSDVSKCGKSSLEVKAASRVTGSPLHKLFGYASPSEVIRETGIRRKGLEVGELQMGVHSHTNSRGNLASKELTEVGMGSPLRKYSEPAISPDFTEVTEGDDLSNNRRKIEDSSLSGFIKKGLKELGQGMESMKMKVFVNGKLLPNRSVKKAEEQAGPIQPGHYWYDYQAGFWGLMGQPCLGTIPPFIEEFNIPMTKDCAGGKTTILVNGRELHQKDLDLLATRGLPTTKNKSYSIEMGGQLIDVASGEELDSLHMLAPTVVKAGHGFGMHAPVGAERTMKISN